MGHTRLKKKKKGWATQKVKKICKGGFDPKAPTKQEQQDIDSFHDFWPLKRGPFNIFLPMATTDPVIKNWHLMRSIIRWLLINYSASALGLTLNPSLFSIAPTYDFNFTPYTTSTPDHLFHTSSLSTSSIEPKGRDYIKIPEAATWEEEPNPFTNFKSLCKALFPNTNDNERNQSTMYIVCDSGAGKFRKSGFASVAHAVPALHLNLDTITKRSAIAGAIAALVQAGNPVVPTIITELAINVLTSKDPTTSGLIYVAPLIIAAAIAAQSVIPVGATPAAVAAAAEAPAQAILGRVNHIVLTPAEKHIQDLIIININATLKGAVSANPNPNVDNVNIIQSAAQQISAAILVKATNISQIIAAANAASTQQNVIGAIGPFVKEIITSQTFADSATANPQPSTIPGDIYPIIYEFVNQGRQYAPPTSPYNPFPEPAPPIANTDDLFYSDSNLYTNRRYEIRYEKNEWSPATGLGFKFVIGDIRPSGSRYEIKFGINPKTGNLDAAYNTLGPNAGLLAACCLKRVLQEPITTVAATATVTYDNINKKLCSLLKKPTCTAIQKIINPFLTTISKKSFADRKDMFHPYLHFKGDTNGPFNQLPPELWFDIKRGGDRDQVMAAYRLSQQRNPNGTLKYPYLVFVTGDELCGAIAVKKGLATIFLADNELRYWPKGIVYEPAATAPAPFNTRLPKLGRPYEMKITPLPVGNQYSIQSWGGNQMKGGYFTMSTHTQIQDGYGNQYSLEQLQPLQQALQQLLQFKPFQLENHLQNNPKNLQTLLQLLQNQTPQILELLQLHQPQQQQQLQHLQQQLQHTQLNQEQLKHLEGVLQRPELNQQQRERITQLLQQHPEQTLTYLLQQDPKPLQKLILQLQFLHITENKYEDYILIDTTRENIEKLLRMDFGESVNMGMILSVCAVLGTGRIVCTPIQLIALIRGIQLRVDKGEPIYQERTHFSLVVETITGHLKKIDTAKSFAQEVSSQYINQATTAQADTTQADTAQAAVNTAISNASGYIISVDPTPLHNFIVFLQTNEDYCAGLYSQDNIQPWIHDMISIFSFTAVPNQTERDPSIPIRAPDAALDDMEKYDIEYMVKQFVYSYRQHNFQQYSAQEQEQFTIEYGTKPIFSHINSTFRGDTLLESTINPIFIYIHGKIIEYLNMPTLSAILASFCTICSMITYNMTGINAKSILETSAMANAVGAMPSASSSTAQPSAASFGQSGLMQPTSYVQPASAAASFGQSGPMPMPSYVWPASAASTATPFFGQAGPAQAASQPSPSNSNAPVMTNATNVASVPAYGSVGPVSAAAAASSPTPVGLSKKLRGITPANRQKEFKKGVNGNKARRKRENLTVRLRREKREAAVTKRRTTASTGTGNLADGTDNLADGGGRRRTQKNHKRKRHGTQRKRSHKGFMRRPKDKGSKSTSQ